MPQLLCFMNKSHDIISSNPRIGNNFPADCKNPEEIAKIAEDSHRAYYAHKSQNAQCTCNTLNIQYIKNNNGYNFNLRIRYHYTINSMFYFIGVTCGFMNKQTYNLVKDGKSNCQHIGNATIWYKSDMPNSSYMLQVKFGGLNCDFQLGIGKTNGLYYFTVYGACLVSNLIIRYRPDNEKEEYDRIVFPNDVSLCSDVRQTVEYTHRVSAQEGSKLERFTPSGEMVKIRTWKKSKFVLSLGIGAEIGIAVARNVIAGIGVVVYPACTGKMSVPGYQNAILHDPYQFGATHHVKVQTLKMYLFVMYKPGMLNKKQIAIKQEANCRICHSQQTTSKYNNFTPKYRHKLSKKNLRS